MFYAGLFLDYMKNYMKTKLTYRADFWIEVISDLLSQAVNLFFILVVFLHTPTLGGWSQAQIVFIYGFFMIPFGIFNCFFNLWGFTERYIVKGELDRILTRPAYNLVQLMLENMDPPSLVGSAAGALIMAYAWGDAGVVFQGYDILVFLLLVIGAVLVYGGIYIIFTAISFFIDAPTGILPMIYNFQSYGRYPVTIYNRLLKAILTWILPFAFVGFYPAAYFLDPGQWGGMALLTPVVGVGFAAAGFLFWNFGIKRYRGAGS